MVVAGVLVVASLYLQIRSKVMVLLKRMVEMDRSERVAAEVEVVAWLWRRFI